MNETLKKVILIDNNGYKYTLLLTEKQLALLEWLESKNISLIDAEIEIVEDTAWIQI